MPDATDPKVEKDVILTSLSAFNPASQDHIVTVSFADGTLLTLRIVRIPDLQMDLINNTEINFTRAVRDQLMAEVKAGARTFRLLDVCEEINQTYSRMTRGELEKILETLWKLDDEAGPISSQMIDEDHLKENVYRFTLIEQLLEVETMQGQGMLPRSLLDLGELKPYEALTPEQRLERHQERIIAVMDERRRPMRALTLEQAKTRLAYAAAMEPASQVAMQRRRCILLYAAARLVEDRNKRLFDLTAVGITDLVQACSDPNKTYQSMIDLFKGDEATLQQTADQIAVDAGEMTPEIRAMLEEAARSPFRPGDVPADEDKREDSWMDSLPPSEVPTRTMYLLRRGRWLQEMREAVQHVTSMRYPKPPQWVIEEYWADYMRWVQRNPDPEKAVQPQTITGDLGIMDGTGGEGEEEAAPQLDHDWVNLLEIIPWYDFYERLERRTYGQVLIVDFKEPGMIGAREYLTVRQRRERDL